MIEDLKRTLDDFVNDPDKYNSVSEDIQDIIDGIKLQITRMENLAREATQRDGGDEEEIAGK